MESSRVMDTNSKKTLKRTSHVVLYRVLAHLSAAIVGHLLWSHRQTIATGATRIATTFADFIIAQMEWFMTARPAGVKLHIQLSSALGTVGLAYVQCWRWILWPLATSGSKLVGLFSFVIPLVGLDFQLLSQLECFSTVAWVVGVPALGAYYAMAQLYRFHVQLTTTLWLAMRGKQPLHWRFWLPLVPNGNETASKSTEAVMPAVASDALDLALASLLFMPCLLTLPTTVWFYAFTCCVYLGFASVVWTIRAGEGWLVTPTDGCADSGHGIGRAIASQYVRGTIVVPSRPRLLHLSSYRHPP